MVANINGCIIHKLLEDIMHVYKTIWNAFVGEVFVCEQTVKKSHSIYSRAAFITIIITCIAAVPVNNVLSYNKCISLLTTHLQLHNHLGHRRTV